MVHRHKKLSVYQISYQNIQKLCFLLQSFTRVPTTKHVVVACFILLHILALVSWHYIGQLLRASAYQTTSYDNSVHMSRSSTDSSPCEIKTSGFYLGSLVYRDKISCHWVTGVSTNERTKMGHPLLKDVILQVLGRLACKWLQIGKDMLLIITCTGDALQRNVNIDDLEWHWTPKIKGFSEFLAILGYNPHFMSKLRQNGRK